MSIFTSYGIIVFAMLILTLLQLSSGVFSLFLHYASGKYSRPKVSRLSIFFILGAEAMATCVFLSLYFLVNLIYLADFTTIAQILLYIFAGISVALAIFCLCFYYRRGKHSELFITRKYARSLERTASKVKSPSDAFVLGALSGNCELFLVAPLYLIIILETLRLDNSCPFALLTILISILPLFLTYWLHQSGQNLANALKSRAHAKMFIRIALCVLYLIIAISIILAEVL